MTEEMTISRVLIFWTFRSALKPEILYITSGLTTILNEIVLLVSLLFWEMQIPKTGKIILGKKPSVGSNFHNVMFFIVTGALNTTVCDLQGGMP
jgi:hypothetical protein